MAQFLFLRLPIRVLFISSIFLKVRPYIVLVELRACRNMIVYHQKVKSFLTVLLVYR